MTTAKTKTQTPTTAEQPTRAPEQPKAPTRGEVLAEIKATGYAGPTSFTATVLRDVAQWLEAGSPQDGNVPRGVMLAVHPGRRPTAAAKTPRLTAHQRGFREAVQAVDALGDDLQAIHRWVAANTAEEVGA